MRIGFNAKLTASEYRVLWKREQEGDMHIVGVHEKNGRKKRAFFFGVP